MRCGTARPFGKGDAGSPRGRERDPGSLCKAKSTKGLRGAEGTLEAPDGMPGPQVDRDKLSACRGRSDVLSSPLPGWSTDPSTPPLLLTSGLILRPEWGIACQPFLHLIPRPEPGVACQPFLDRPPGEPENGLIHRVR